MKLGIIVVYLVSENNGPLLDLHLQQIERFTDVPYTIYASTNRSCPEVRNTLEQRPNVNIYDIPTTDLRWGLEHTYYLEHLIRIAIDDGVTHVAILHVDSFPIKARWVEELEAMLSAEQAFVTLDTAYTACLFFSREFYLNHHPTMRVSEDEKTSDGYRDFCLKCHPIEPDSGVGYLYRAYLDKLDYYFIPRVTKVMDNTVGLLYGDTIFHLGSSVMLSREQPEALNSWERLVSRSIPLFRTMRWKLDAYLPRSVIMRIRQKLISFRLEAQRYQMSRADLLADPDRFFERLRTGK